jgi:hypothetical protein
MHANGGRRGMHCASYFRNTCFSKDASTPPDHSRSAVSPERRPKLIANVSALSSDGVPASPERLRAQHSTFAGWIQRQRSESRPLGRTFRAP